MSKLAFRTVEQAAMFKHELAGQISDGHWENSRPYDHWKPWCLADVVVDPENPGRDFYARRERYNFSDPKLLEVVGLRMLGQARLGRALGIESEEFTKLHWAVTCEGKLYRHKEDEIPVDLLQRAQAALADESYTYRDMKRDLNEMKLIIKQRRQ